MIRIKIGKINRFGQKFQSKFNLLAQFDAFDANRKKIKTAYMAISDSCLIKLDYACDKKEDN